MGFIKIVLGVVVGIIVAVVLLVVGCATLVEVGKRAETKSKYLAATNSVQDSFIPSTALQINKDWKWELDKNYSHVRGSVKNISGKSIRYWKITAKYHDKTGNVVNQEIDNSTDLLMPNDSDQFEITAKNNKAYDFVIVEASEVRFQ